MTAGPPTAPAHDAATCAGDEECVCPACLPPRRAPRLETIAMVRDLLAGGAHAPPFGTEPRDLWGPGWSDEEEATIARKALVLADAALPAVRAQAAVGERGPLGAVLAGDALRQGRHGYGCPCEACSIQTEAMDALPEDES